MLGVPALRKKGSEFAVAKNRVIVIRLLGAYFIATTVKGPQCMQRERGPFVFKGAARDARERQNVAL